MSGPRCEICLASTAGDPRHAGMCFSCGRSYDRYSNAGAGTIMDALVWAARRARRTLLARQREEAKRRSTIHDARVMKLTREIKRLKADASRPCNCVDCDGRWCDACLTHHGRRTCPLVSEAQAELAKLLEARPT